jgi:hypothetical protein
MLFVPLIVVGAARGSAQFALSYTKVWFVLSKGEGKTTSFVGANFTRAQLRRLPIDGTHAGPGRSMVWLTHAWHRSLQEAEIRPF